jgi:hypothetical protein
MIIIKNKYDKIHNATKDDPDTNYSLLNEAFIKVNKETSGKLNTLPTRYDWIFKEFSAERKKKYDDYCSQFKTFLSLYDTYNQ